MTDMNPARYWPTERQEDQAVLNEVQILDEIRFRLIEQGPDAALAYIEAELEELGYPPEGEGRKVP